MLQFRYGKLKKVIRNSTSIGSAWFIKDVKFKAIGKTNGQSDIYLDFTTGAQFQDETGALCPDRDTKKITWQHLDFFRHTCFLHARVIRIKTTSGNTRQVEVPWAQPNSGFTLLFEAFAMTLIECEMPVARAAKILKLWSPRL